MRVIAITYLALIIPALAQKLAQPNINDCMSSEYFLSTYDSWHLGTFLPVVSILIFSWKKSQFPKNWEIERAWSNPTHVQKWKNAF